MKLRTKVCPMCSKPFTKVKDTTYCTPACYHDSLRGKKHTEEHNSKISESMKKVDQSWKIGKPHGHKTSNGHTWKLTEEQRAAISRALRGRPHPTGENSVSWKGDSVGYHGLHKWVYTVLGRPNKCEHCGTTTAKKFEWANKSHKYLRDVGDWLRLCTRCHRLYDYGKLSQPFIVDEPK